MRYYNIEVLNNLFQNPESAYCPGSNCCGNLFFIDEELLLLLNKLIDKLSSKLHIKYLYKCNRFNASIKGRNKYHSLGLAADIDTILSDLNPVALASLAWDLGFNAVGVYGTNEVAGYNNKKGMVHLGIESEARFWGDWNPYEELN